MRLLGEERPDDGVLGEEEGGATGTSGLTWVVDPIDGTVNYLYGIPSYAVSVAVVTGDPTRPGHWEAVAGAVLNPETGELFHAHRGGGARLTTARGHPHAAGHRGHRPGHGPRRHRLRVRRSMRARQAALLVDLLPRVRDIRRHGSAALDLCGLAAGRLDAYYETALNAWDRAAGELVAREAGCRRRWTGRRRARPATSSGVRRPVWPRCSATSCASSRRGTSARWTEPDGRPGGDAPDGAGTAAARRTKGARTRAGRHPGARWARAARLPRDATGGPGVAPRAAMVHNHRARRSLGHKHGQSVRCQGRVTRRRVDTAMATDYDAPRKTDDELSEDSIEELKSRRVDKRASSVDVDETEQAEGFELPGADLSGEELSVRVLPRQADEFTCSRCFLVHHRSQLASEKSGVLVCRECAA